VTVNRSVLVSGALLAAMSAAYGVATSEASGHPLAAPGPVFTFTFDDRPRRDGGEVHYRARGGFTGTLLSARDGEVTLVRVPGQGRAARFPAPCRGSSCPRALIDVPDDSRLDPRDADFWFGARLRMLREEATNGSNVLQKGRFHTPGGFWKLQVDDPSGRPSCVVRGGVGRTGTTVVVRSPDTVADGVWHEVTCARTSGSVTITVDGHRTRSAASVPRIANDSPVRIGGPGLSGGDDQFHGRVDDVFLTLGR
jgi:hypothetical protein